jgi:hypothetical protein
MTEAPVDDEILAELRRLERVDSRRDDAGDRDAMPRRLAGLADRVPSPNATGDAA